LDAADADVLGRVAAREQPLGAGTLGLPVGPQQVEQLRREHDQARFAALAVGDAQRHARTVDIAHAQGDDFEDTQAGGIGGDQHGAHLAVGDGREKPAHLLDAEHGRQLMRPPLQRQLGQHPVPLQHDHVEETQGGDVDVEIRGRDVPPDQVVQVIPELLRPNIRRRHADVASKTAHSEQIVALRVG